MLRMFIGQPEARAIQVSWRGAVPPRPSTWDLFVSTIELLGGRLHEAVITAVEEERHFFAAMELTQGDGPRTVACRPSDALALALRSPGARILTTEDVMEAAGVLADGSKPGRIERPAPEPESETPQPAPETPQPAPEAPAHDVAVADVPVADVPAKKSSARKPPVARKAPVAKKAPLRKPATTKAAAGEAVPTPSATVETSASGPVTSPPVDPPPRRAAAVRKALPPRPPDQSGR
jgi:bifunctional DNase/RNase